MAKRSIIRFDSNNDVWSTIENWAKERNFREKARKDGWRQYQQGNAILVAPKVVEIQQEGTQIEIQAYVHIPLVNLIITLFFMPGEIDLGRGIKASVPRNTARRDVNILLDRMGQVALHIKG